MLRQILAGMVELLGWGSALLASQCLRDHIESLHHVITMILIVDVSLV